MSHRETGDREPIVKDAVRSTGQDHPNAPLMIRFGALGDMILTTGILRGLARRHGRPCAVVGRGRFVKDLFKHLPFVGEVHCIWSNKAPYLINVHKWRLVKWLRKTRFSIVCLFQDDLISYKIVDRARLVPRAANLQMERRLNEHVIDHMARLAGFIDKNGSYTHDFHPGTELVVSPAEVTGIRQKLLDLGAPADNYMIIHPGYRKYSPKLGHRKRLSKHWPEDRWAELIRLIRDSNQDLNIMITGSTPEAPLGQTILEKAGDHKVFNLAGQLNLRELLALIHSAKNIVSVDTGTAHAAAALNCPLVVLFGKTDPRVNGPVSRTSPVHIVTGPEDAPVLDGEEGWSELHSMMGIDPAKVFNTWKNLQN